MELLEKIQTFNRDSFHYRSFCKEDHFDIRIKWFCCIVYKSDPIIFQKYRNRVKLPLLEEENERYDFLTAIRRRPSLHWDSKLIKPCYFTICNDRLSGQQSPYQRGFCFWLILNRIKKTWTRQ